MTTAAFRHGMIGVDIIDARCDRFCNGNRFDLGTRRVCNGAGDRIGYNALHDGGVFEALNGLAREYAVRSRYVDVACAHLFKFSDGAHKGTCGIDHIVVDDAGFAFYVADDAHHLSGIVLRLSLIHI